VQLHPLGGPFGVLAGGEIAGILGVYLSIPVMASLRIVWRRWRIYAEKRKFGPLNEFSLPHDLAAEEADTRLAALSAPSNFRLHDFSGGFVHRGSCFPPSRAGLPAKQFSRESLCYKIAV